MLPNADFLEMNPDIEGHDRLKVRQWKHLKPDVWGIVINWVRYWLSLCPGRLGHGRESVLPILVSLLFPRRTFLSTL
jgi:hypothetical protein